MPLAPLALSLWMVLQLFAAFSRAELLCVLPWSASPEVPSHCTKPFTLSVHVIAWKVSIQYMMMMMMMMMMISIFTYISPRKQMWLAKKEWRLSRLPADRVLRILETSTFRRTLAATSRAA